MPNRHVWSNYVLSAPMVRCLSNDLPFSGRDAAEPPSRLYPNARAAALSDCNGWFGSTITRHGPAPSSLIGLVSLTVYSCPFQVASIVYRCPIFRPARAGLWMANVNVGSSYLPVLTFST